MQDKRNYENLIELIEIVIDLNDKLYEPVMKKRYDYSYSRANIDYKSIIKYTKSKTLYIRNSQYTRLALIKIESIQQRKENNFKKKRNNKKKKICYEYDKAYHFLKNCRSKVMLRRTINIMSRVTFEKKKSLKNRDKTQNALKTYSKENDFVMIEDELTSFIKYIKNEKNIAIAKKRLTSSKESCSNTNKIIIDSKDNKNKEIKENIV